MKDPDRVRRAAVRVTRYMNPDKKRDRPMTMTEKILAAMEAGLPPLDDAYAELDSYLLAVDPEGEMKKDAQVARMWDGENDRYAVLTIGTLVRLLFTANEVLLPNTRHAVAATDPAHRGLMIEVPTPGARRGDPATSHLSAAEAALHADKGRGRILITFVRAERIGITSMTSEGVVAMADMGHQKSPWKRVSDLKTAGLIETTGETHRGMTGRDAELLRLTEAGRKRAKEQMPDAWAAIVGDS